MALEVTEGTKSLVHEAYNTPVLIRNSRLSPSTEVEEILSSFALVIDGCEQAHKETSPLEALHRSFMKAFHNAG